MSNNPSFCRRACARVFITAGMSKESELRVVTCSVECDAHGAGNVLVPELYRAWQVCGRTAAGGGRCRPEELRRRANTVVCETTNHTNHPSYPQGRARTRAPRP